MSALVKKEIRLLLPVWGMAMLLVVGAPWIVFRRPWSIDGTELALFFGGTVILAVASFGREFSLGTFSFLLSQPAARQRFWGAKVFVLAVAFASLLAAFCFSFQLRANAILANPVWQDQWYADSMSSLKQWVQKEPYLGTLFAVMAFTGGLWAALLFRQVASAFWVALLIPAFISLGVSWVLPPDGFLVLAGAWILYSIAGIWWAWRLFQRAEDAAWIGGTATLPVGRLFNIGSRSAAGPRRRSPLAALIGKELQLHHTTLLCAAGLLVLHFGIIALRKVDGSFGWTTRALLDGFLSVWLAVPLIIGCSAVAEERRLGTMEEHLCLPVSRRVQFSIKFLVTLFLGALLGAALPWAVESIGGLLGAASSIMKEPASGLFAWVQVLVAALAIAGISFYASTLTPNILQALATAVAAMIGMGCVIVAIIAAVEPSSGFGYLLCGRRLADYFVWTLMIAWTVTAICLAYGNFKHLHRGWRLWLRNILSLAVVLVFLAAFTTALYHRAWECLTPIEPAHGPARLTGAKPATILTRHDPLAVLLPDGRLWRESLVFKTSKLGFSWTPKLISPSGGPFVGGSNWVDAVWGWRDTVGIQSDGSLWVSETPTKPKPLRMGEPLVQEQAPASLVRYGAETNWQEVATWGGLSVLLLKTDGTLWGWGTNRWLDLRNEWPGLRAFNPRRLGTESNWAEIFRADFRVCLRKTDGSVWMVGGFSNGREGKEITEIEPGLTFERVTSLESGKWHGAAEAQLSSNLPCWVGVRSDGTFRLWADEYLPSKSRYYEWAAADVQIGGETNWLAVAGVWEKIVTLKRDGSLWLWHFGRDWNGPWDPKRDERELAKKFPVQLGTHSDWVAIGRASNGIFSLAADGSLWYWQLDDASLHWDEGPQPLLAASRKPQQIGNIFPASSTTP
jgi:ABC-type transport system involved in multi-copper enzyme maturation permease subunit